MSLNEPKKIMKKVTLALAAVCLLGLASCKTNYWTATEVPATNMLVTNTIANLEVGQKVTFRYNVPANVRKGGTKNCKAAAIQAMLKANGGADVIVAPEYNYDNTLTYIEVTGRPAKYVNFKSVN